MTHAILAAVLLALAPLARAQKVGEFATTVEQFGGQNTYIDSARLPPGSAQSASNVLTEHGYIERRPGSALAATFAGANENIAEYVKASGSRLLVSHVGDNLYQTDLGQSPVLFSTVAASSAVDFVVAFNKLISVDGTHEIEYDGASTTSAFGFPGCKYVEFYLDRIWCANILAETNSAVRISSVGGSGFWTIPASPQLAPDAPNEFYFSRNDGYPITCMKKTPWGIVIGKRRKMGIIKGLDNTNWYVREIDPAIGCVDDRTMQMVEGRLQWLAVDGVYSWEGSGPIKLESLEIESTIKSLRQSASQTNSWAVDSQSDFESGVLNGNGPGAPMSATMLPGSVIGSSFTFTTTSTTDFAGGTLTNVSTSAFGISLSTAQVFYTWDHLGTSGSQTVYPASVTVHSAATGTDFSTSLSSYTQLTGTFTFVTTLTGMGGINSAFVFFMLDSNGVGATGAPTGHGYDLQLKSAESGIYKWNNTVRTLMLALTVPAARTSWTIYRDATGHFSVMKNGVAAGSFTDTTYGTPAYSGISIITNNDSQSSSFELDSYKFPSTTGSFTSASYDTTLSTPTWGNFAASVSSGVAASLGYSTVTLYTQSSPDNITWSALAPATIGSIVTSPQAEWVRWIATFTVISTGPAGVLNVPSANSATILAATTGYYYSAVHFVGSDLSSWGNFDVTETLPTGSGDTYGVRLGTYAFGATSTSIAWSTQAVGALVNLSLSTPTYVQWRSSMNFVNASSAPAINLVRINWNSGSPTTSAASVFLNHRYVLCVAISSSVNDTCLIQQRTKSWVPMDGQYLGALTLYNNDIYGGSALSDGKVWRELQDGLYTDDGAAINSYWVTPDYLLNDPVAQKVTSEIWMDAQPSTGTLLSVGYAIDKSTSYASRTLDLGYNSDYVNRRVPIDAARAIGKYFRMKFSNSQATPLRINSFTIFTQLKPRLD